MFSLQKYFILLGVLVLFGLTSCQSSLKKLREPANGYTFAFYNVENLFDTINDPLINDEEFLPEAKGQWNTQKLNHKLENMARVIASMDTGSFPHMLGLAEIENREVLEMLVQLPVLSKAKYEIIHVADQDPRGIETALLYRSEYFRPIQSKELNFTIDSMPDANPRHILYVKGVVESGDTLHLMINHWTSRYGGQDVTVKSRNSAGEYVRHIADSLLAMNPLTNLIIAGDLNDNPTDPSLTQYLKALPVTDPVESGRLYNLALKPFAEGKGTLYYKSWDCFDQIIVSPSLLLKKIGSFNTGELQIIDRKWMMYASKNGVLRPNRTYSGGKYFGGYSDHLPVMIRLQRLR